ncbi:MAG: excinuclease ABC subunit UvrA [Candidatus Gracilibacteria bacterium]|nr:excinuclease ABC subunit UvrA [Candidatus Gracilibacteria bacterium]
MSQDKIIVKGAKVHNLKNVSVEIPRDKMTVITGLSGSGKSSLAFDTIFAEGQRRYIESLSTYARQFLNLMEKPDVEEIKGLSPAIAIDQKTTSRNPRSTVGTVTEIYDFFRLIFAKIGTAHCPKCGDTISRQSISQIIEKIEELPEGNKFMILAPIVRGKKGEHQVVLDQIKKDGFVRFRLDGNIYSVLDEITLDPKKKHDIEIIVDRLVVKDFQPKITKLKSGQEIEEPNPDRTRLADSIELSLGKGEGLVIIHDVDNDKDQLFSERYSCAKCDINIPEIHPRMFSFNSPHGACEECHGLGTKLKIDQDMVMPNTRLTLAEGAILPWSSTNSKLSWYNRLLEQVAKKHKFSLNDPVKKLKQEHLDVILHGDPDNSYKMPYDSDRFEGEYTTTFEGVIPNLERRYKETDSNYVHKKIEQFMRILDCPKCLRKRLRPESLAIKIGGVDIIAVTDMSITQITEFFAGLDLSVSDKKIAEGILREINSRLGFLINVGLEYLTLSRVANTLSGGEAQRIRLATQIGSQLQGVLYVLDEPSIGLHQRDNDRLIETLIKLRDLGNTVLVVEHDEDIMRSCDYILDIGPGAGKYGGQVIASGTPAQLMKDKNSVTGQYLSGKKEIPIPKTRRKGNGHKLSIIGAEENNLQNVSVDIPLGMMTAVTGVSGSGKSSLINQILVKKLAGALNKAKSVPGKHDEITGIEHLDKIINIDQSPIGRTPRSNAATYTGVFTHIRELFASTPEAKLRGYKSGRFSFNVKGGRCEDCRGDGLKKIEMHFLADIYVSCEVCNGKRYNKEALEITWRGKHIADILQMSVAEALVFFANIPDIKRKLDTLSAVGLDYIQLGQSATTLSGGEAQRIKLSNELSKRSTGKTIYVLDEPTTGLHFDDVQKLLDVLHRLVEGGNSIVVIEHNLDVIKCADWIIDIGPEGGINGGLIVAEGTPEEVAKCKESHTGKYIKKILAKKK